MMDIEVPKTCEHIISTIKHSVTSSWFFFSMLKIIIRYWRANIYGFDIKYTCQTNGKKTAYVIFILFRNVTCM